LNCAFDRMLKLVNGSSALRFASHLWRGGGFAGGLLAVVLAASTCPVLAAPVPGADLTVRVERRSGAPVYDALSGHFLGKGPAFGLTLKKGETRVLRY